MNRRSLSPSILETLSCPACSAALEIADGLIDPQVTPKEGDATVCDRCGAILTFHQRGVRIAAAAELSASPEHALRLSNMSLTVRMRRASQPDPIVHLPPSVSLD